MYTVLRLIIKIFLILIGPAVFLYGQENPESTIRSLNSKLKAGSITVTDILTNSDWMDLHGLTPFREIIKQHAQSGELTVTTKDEPGERVTVKGLIVNKERKPLRDVLLYFYHTSAKGWYGESTVHIAEGDYEHARLFGYIKTNEAGQFSIKTIKPNGYPQSDLAGHIHIQLWDSNGKLLSTAPGELQFADDPRMTPERKKRAFSEGFLVASNTGTPKNPVYQYTIIVEE